VNEKVGDINKQITDFNKLRKQAVEATLALCLVFLIIQIGINAADVFCKSGSKPNQTTICGFCVTPTITLLFCVFLFLLFILAFVLHIVAATVADVCVTPDTLIISQQEDKYITYFVKCDEYTKEQQAAANPLLLEFGQLDKQLNSSAQTLDDLQSEVDAIGSPGCSAAVQTKVDDVKDINSAVAANYAKLKESMSCARANPLYTNLIGEVCDDLHTSLALMYAALAAVAILMSFVECTRRLIRPGRKVEDDEFDNVAPAYAKGETGDANKETEFAGQTTEYSNESGN